MRDKAKMFIIVDEWMLVFNGDDSFEFVETQDMLYNEELKKLFYQEWKK